ncbi:hypothetical protein E2C01_067465 [Portunus trituberculatus]|uniref:Uncharacterized protein n=1 Tax=Portunus trituberculatus TaxID=210409 RepID=A0A5B7HWS7_PORTR|nr:hypothetical protein [Portunus trituberculatus]
MYRVVGPQPFGCELSSFLPVLGGRGSGRTALSDTVGPRGTAVTISRRSPCKDRFHHKKPDLSRRVSQEAEQKLLELP